MGGFPRRELPAGRHDNVQVAVQVQVDRLSVEGPRRFGDQVPRPGSGRRTAAVLVPDDDGLAGFGGLDGDDLLGSGGGQQIPVAVGVDVRGPDRGGLPEVAFDQVLVPGFDRRIRRVPRVLEPGEPVSQPPGGRRHVQVAVGVQIGQGDIVGAGQRSLGDVPPFPKTAVPGTAAVLEPEQVPVQVLHDHHVRMSVPVDVPHGVTLEALGIVLLDEAAGELPRPVVLEPVQVVVRKRVGAGQIQVAVAVQIGGRDSEGIGVPVHDQVLGELNGGRRGRGGWFFIPRRRAREETGA